MSPDRQPPERALAVYRDDRLILVLSSGGGRILRSTHPSSAVEHPHLHGKLLLVAADERQLLDAVRDAPDLAAAAERLERGGWRSVLTPISALAWALEE